MNEQNFRPSDDYFNDLAKAVFHERVGRPHPWEGVQCWVVCAMRDAYEQGQKSVQQAAQAMLTASQEQGK